MTPAFYDGGKSFIGALEESHSIPLVRGWLAAQCKPIPDRIKRGLS